MLDRQAFKSELDTALTLTSFTHNLTTIVKQLGEVARHSFLAKDLLVFIHQTTTVITRSAVHRDTKNVIRLVKQVGSQ